MESEGETRSNKKDGVTQDDQTTTTSFRPHISLPHAANECGA